jgi:hypothetical protein
VAVKQDTCFLPDRTGVELAEGFKVSFQLVPLLRVEGRQELGYLGINLVLD